MFRILNIVNIVLSLSRVYFVFRVMFCINLIFTNLYCVLIVIRILNISCFNYFSSVTSYVIIKCRVVIFFYFIIVVRS